MALLVHKSLIFYNTMLLLWKCRFQGMISALIPREFSQMGTALFTAEFHVYKATNNGYQ